MEQGGSAQLQLPRRKSSSGFEFPTLYSYAPFFTQQPNTTTWNHQSNQWSDLILAYCKFHRIFQLDLTTETTVMDLFNNTSIQRKISLPTLKLIIEQMIQSGSAEYDQLSLKSKVKSTSVLIYWKRPEEWAKAIYDWVEGAGLLNSIMTFYELTTGGDLAHITEFYKLAPNLLKRALNVLEKTGKAQVFKSNADEDGETGEGVKFL